MFGENIFAEYKRETLTEAFFKDLLTKIQVSFNSFKKFIISKLSSLDFGKEVSISLSFSGGLSEAKEGPIDLKSRLGYYSELCTASELAKLLSSKKLNLTGLTKNKLKSEQEKYKKTKLTDPQLTFKGATLSVVETECQRMEESGYAMAESIVNDVLSNIEDLEFVQFEIVLTGESGKGKTKADIELIVRKADTKKVIEHVEASLKAYKGWRINVSNSTFTSWVINLVDPSLGGFSNKSSVDSKVGEFIEKYGYKKEMRAIQNYQVGPNSPAKLKKQIGRDAAKKIVDDEGIYIKVRDLMIKVFEGEYKKRKKEINSNFLTLLGFDGADDLYIAVENKRGKPIEVLSSRKSEAFKSLMEKMQDDFDISFERSKTKVNTSITFKHKEEVLFTSNFAFRDLDKVSQFVSFQNFK